MYRSKLKQYAWRLRRWIGRPLTYVDYCRRYGCKGGTTCDAEQQLNAKLIDYPRNHNYAIHDRRVKPSFKLHERHVLFESLYGPGMSSFLDIGCCRGFYVVQAACQGEQVRAMGIDLHRPFVETAGAVSEHLGIDNAQFEYASISDVADNIDRFGGPFDSVLLVGTYHYLFWGSDLNPHAYFDHDAIFATLRKLCSGRLILSGRLEMSHLSSSCRIPDEHRSKVAQYTTEHFVDAANRHFDVETVGHLGKYPLFVMTAR